MPYLSIYAYTPRVSLPTTLTILCQKNFDEPYVAETSRGCSLSNMICKHLHSLQTTNALMGNHTRLL